MEKTTEMKKKANEERERSRIMPRCYVKTGKPDVVVVCY